MKDPVAGVLSDFLPEHNTRFKDMLMFWLSCDGLKIELF